MSEVTEYPESVVRNAREMHTCVNSFLNSADDGLNLWKRTESRFFQSESFAKKKKKKKKPKKTC
jgi:hypothetical protein